MLPTHIGHIITGRWERRDIKVSRVATPIVHIIRDVEHLSEHAIWWLIQIILVILCRPLNEEDLR